MLFTGNNLSRNGNNVDKTVLIKSLPSGINAAGEIIKAAPWIQLSLNNTSRKNYKTTISNNYSVKFDENWDYLLELIFQNNSKTITHEFL